MGNCYKIKNIINIYHDIFRMIPCFGGKGREDPWGGQRKPSMNLCAVRMKWKTMIHPWGSTFIFSELLRGAGQDRAGGSSVLPIVRSAELLQNLTSGPSHSGGSFFPDFLMKTGYILSPVVGLFEGETDIEPYVANIVCLSGKGKRVENMSCLSGLLTVCRGRTVAVGFWSISRPGDRLVV